MTGIFYLYISTLAKMGEIMRTFSFDDSVRLQFNALMMIVIKGKLKNKHRQFVSHSKHEVLFFNVLNCLKT